ncbi:MAG: hypothetical protein WAM72_08505, partial [Xanthobacteraceae bacterium]
MKRLCADKIHYFAKSPQWRCDRNNTTMKQLSANTDLQRASLIFNATTLRALGGTRRMMPMRVV